MEGQVQEKATPRIDGHLHVFAKASSRFPREVDEVLPPDREEPAEKLLAEMEANGVDQAVLVQIGGTRFEQHAYLQRCVKAYPNRFLGIGLIPPESVSPEAHMDRLAESGGIIGFRLSNLGGDAVQGGETDIEQIPAYRIWRHAAERDYVLWLYARESDAPLVPGLVKAFPSARVVLNHLGVCPTPKTFSWDEKGRPRIETPMPPRTSEITLGLRKYENVSVHISGQYAFSNESWPYRDLAGWHKALLDAFGAKRLIWATDFPWILEDPGYGRLTRVVDELLPGLSASERDAVMGGNAKRVLRFPDLQF